MLTEPSLWQFLRDSQNRARAGQEVSRLPGGTILVTSGGLARKVLINERNQYKEQSGFLRIGSTVVDRKVRASIVQSLIRALNQHRFGSEFDIHRVIEGLSSGSSPRLKQQTWGVRCIQEYFRPVIGTDRPQNLQAIVNRYVEKSIIPDDIQGRIIRSRTAVAQTRANLAALFEAGITVNDPPLDLIDVVHIGAPDLSNADKAELCQRLILSLVGFTGITLEWAVIFGALSEALELTDEALDFHISECLRLHPTAWRLARTIISSHALGTCPVVDGEHLLISIHAIHTDEKVWDDADEFVPSRWRHLSREQKDAYMPFGRGPEMCPSERFARTALRHCTREIFEKYEVSANSKSLSKPKALTLLSPSVGHTRLIPKTNTIPGNVT